jgi:hypothetical protein
MPFPILEVSTVVGCKMRCSYCPQAVHVQRYHEDGAQDRQMSLATFQQALSTVPRGVRVVFAGMAEPFLNSLAPDFMVHAHVLGHPVAVYSTLAGLHPGDVQRVASIPFAEFVIHLPDNEGRMKFDVTDDYLLLLKAVRKAIPCSHFSVIGPVHHRIAPIVGPVNDDTAGLISRAGNIGKKIGKTGALRCSAMGDVMDHNVLLPNGNVVLCCCDYSLKHVLGNLTTQTWSSLFTGEEYLSVKRGLAGDESIPLICRSCELSVPA